MLGLVPLPDECQLGILEAIGVGGMNLSRDVTGAVGRTHRGSWRAFFQLVPPVRGGMAGDTAECAPVGTLLVGA